MKAVVYERYGGPELLRLSDVDMPEPAKGEIRVKVLACAVNLSDWEYLTGSPAWVRTVGGLFKPKVPVLGSDIVGLVDKLGEDVSGFEIGQRVMGDYVMTRGGFAEYACVPAHETVAVPDALSDDIAACLPQAGGIAVAGTDGLSAGDRLLINGAGGGSGTMAMQLAKAAGVYVTAVDNAGKIEWLASLGADETIDYAKVNFTEMGKTWDRILDMVATRGPREISRALIAGGTYMALGGGVPTLLSIVFGGKLLARNRSIGMLLVPSGQDLTRRVAEFAIQGRIAPHVEAVLPFSSVPDALARTGKGKVLGKIVIKPSLE
ncbi:Alcohol dehydrogenase [Aliiroseovarius pelagivivens]|uniref:Alcohol dehydrogenase n=1 Tax=Aliiroseovarius pelagivivens TaxID=1639690 RepID=A0A2R8AHA2_9RHOB|nr:NAD(P)-dependent alcohol dehydrogenase [Aliiroseovarius pelagivivens]SPF75224.1 Alcohol dehydrogenase [Aliiroseovarius pelagivivens]